MLVGYIHGVAVVLVCGQLGKLLGIPIEASEPVGQVVDAVKGLGHVSSTTVLLSAFLLPIGHPRARRQGAIRLGS